MQTAPPILLSQPPNSDTDSRLSEFAHQLAKTHTLAAPHSPKTTLLADLHGWELALRHANAIFKAAPARDAPVSRAGEWMLDNFYIVKQTLRQIEEDLPASFLSQLPILAATPLPGLPRPVRVPGLPRICASTPPWLSRSASVLF